MNNLFLILIFLLQINNAHAQTLEKTIPITMNNLKGHKALFDEGYYVITSSRQALDYAYSQGVLNSKQVWQEISKLREARKIKKKIDQNESTQKTELISQNLKKNLADTGQQILQDTEEVAQYLDIKAIESRKTAFEALTLGYLQFSQRTEQDIEEIKKLKTSWFSGLKNDFRNFGQIYEELNEKEEVESKGFFEKNFLSAKEEIQKEYKKSGERSNSLSALLDLSWGYIKGLYYGVVKPTGEGALSVTKLTYNVISKTLASTTKIFFYSSAIGYKIIAPSVEAGYLGSLSLVQWASARGLAIGGRSLYLINQIAVVGSEPVYKGGKWMLSTVADTAESSVLTIFDYGEGIGQIAYNNVKAGMVLGINAITALPAQTILAAANSVVFLAYDGPRLAIYAARGDFNSMNLNEIPIGIVLDMEKLQKQNIKIEKISEDSTDIQNVIRESSKDLVP